jgi:glycosyltransferase involved in cell wall biosynthesis
MSNQHPMITVAVASLNQGRFLGDALQSIFSQNVPVEVFVADGGSTDDSLSVIKKWESQLMGWRSHPDKGQAAAINEGIAKGNAPYVAWLNSDDLYLPGGLSALLCELEKCPELPGVYAQTWNVNSKLQRTSKVWVQPFSERRLAMFCIISQPATLIRRKLWEASGGLREDLHMAMDYDLWWRLYRKCGPLGYIEREVALNRNHDQTKTRTQRKRHYQEAVAVVREHYGRVPIKWWLAWPISVWLRSWITDQKFIKQNEYKHKQQADSRC